MTTGEEKTVRRRLARRELATFPGVAAFHAVNAFEVEMEHPGGFRQVFRTTARAKDAAVARRKIKVASGRIIAVHALTNHVAA
jgi:4'-phosphopantetheinyl transferase EntD